MGKTAGSMVISESQDPFAQNSYGPLRGSLRSPMSDMLCQQSNLDLPQSAGTFDGSLVPGAVARSVERVLTDALLWTRPGDQYPQDHR